MRTLLLTLLTSALFYACTSNSNKNFEPITWKEYFADSSYLQNYAKLVDFDTMYDSVKFCRPKSDSVFIDTKYIYLPDVVNKNVRIDFYGDSIQIELNKPIGQWIGVIETDLGAKNLNRAIWGPDESELPRTMTIHKDSINSSFIFVDDWDIKHISDSTGVSVHRLYFTHIYEQK
tara:strand:- start:3729 stop:4253 length:525 start_codon:yes stop_codon:yes gene_type:complete